MSRAGQMDSHHDKMKDRRNVPVKEFVHKIQLIKDPKTPEPETERLPEMQYSDGTIASSSVDGRIVPVNNVDRYTCNLPVPCQVNDQQGSNSSRSKESDISYFCQRNSIDMNNLSSLMLFNRRRAPVDYQGFVDVITLAQVKSNSARGMCVLNRLVNLSGHSYEHLDSLPKGTTSRQRLQLLTETLPNLEYQRDICALASCLATSDTPVQQDVSFRLERLLLLNKYREIPGYTELLMTVAQTTHIVFMELPNSSDNFQMCTHLHLLAACALVCLADHSVKLDISKLFVVNPKLGKKLGHNDEKRRSMKAMQVYYEKFTSQLTDLNLSSAQERTKRFSRAPFCGRCAYAFFLMNEIAQQEWNEQAKVFLEELRQLYEATPADGKHALCLEAMSVFNFLLVRGLVVLLKTTYEKVKLQVGDTVYDQPKMASDLARTVIKKAEEKQQSVLVKEVSSLIYHESFSVREVFNELLQDSQTARLYFALDYTLHCLLVADFVVDVSKSEVEQQKKCSWHHFSGRFGQEQVEGVVYVHSAGCVRKDSERDCERECGKCFKDKFQYGRNLDYLRRLCPRENILQLMAYQLVPFPFYATEVTTGRRLLEHLINHRNGHRWLDTPTLAHVAGDIVKALEFLEKQGIASREITAFDMIVDGRRRRGGRSGEVIEVLASDNFAIKLASFGLAHSYLKENVGSSETVIPVIDQGPIPVLWTSPEALLKGEYSNKSMVYSLGAVMYELWTHGCQPFTVYRQSTSEILKTMLLKPDSVALLHWQCIPDDVYSLIKSCTAPDPTKRPSLQTIEKCLEDIRKNQENQERETLSDFSGDTEYPSFTDSQLQRKHVPERGIPDDVIQLICELKYNTHMKQTPSKLGGLPDDTVQYSVEGLEIIYKQKMTVVRENLSDVFRKKLLPTLEECVPIPGISEWTESKKRKSELDQSTVQTLVHERNYPLSWTLKDVATKGKHASNGGYTTFGIEHFLVVFQSLTQRLLSLHKSGWLHCDLRASTVLVTCDSGQAIMIRIGRMRQLLSGSKSLIEEPFEDNHTWLAPEVITEGKYTSANDVYMLGTTFWEALWTKEVTDTTTVATDKTVPPLAHLGSGTLMLEGRQLPKPKLCPDWLYETIVQCRHSNPAKRSAVQDVLNILDQHIGTIRLPNPFLPRPPLSSSLPPTPTLPPREYSGAEAPDGVKAPVSVKIGKAKKSKKPSTSNSRHGKSGPEDPGKSLVNFDSVLLHVPDSTYLTPTLDGSSVARAPSGAGTTKENFILRQTKAGPSAYRDRYASDPNIQPRRDETRRAHTQSLAIPPSSFRDESEDEDHIYHEIPSFSLRHNKGKR